MLERERRPDARTYEELVLLVTEWHGGKAHLFVDFEGSPLVRATGYLVELEAEPGTFAFGLAHEPSVDPHTTFLIHDHEAVNWALAEPSDPLVLQFQLCRDEAIVDVVLTRSPVP